MCMNVRVYVCIVYDCFEHVYVCARVLWVYVTTYQCEW